MAISVDKLALETVLTLTLFDGEGIGTGWGNKAAKITLDNNDLTKKYGKSSPSFFPVYEDEQLPISKVDLADEFDKVQFYNANDPMRGNPGPMLPFFNIFNI